MGMETKRSPQLLCSKLIKPTWQPRARVTWSNCPERSRFAKFSSTVCFTLFTADNNVKKILYWLSCLDSSCNAILGIMRITGYSCCSIHTSMFDEQFLYTLMKGNYVTRLNRSLFSIFYELWEERIQWLSLQAVSLTCKFQFLACKSWASAWSN